MENHKAMKPMHYLRLLVASLSLLCFHTAYSTGFDTLTLDPNLPVIPTPPTVNPDGPYIPTVSNKYSVGTPQGAFSVSPSGSATYQLSIEAPNGGSLSPQIALVYDSQNSSYGVAGYGISVSGISAITRGEKSLFNNDGNVQGVTYTENDNLYLDGTRLILMSGEVCRDGAEYCLEGAPHTKIIIHGNYDDSSTDVWFEMKTPDGLTYHYGNATDTSIRFTDKSGKQRVASWYVSRMEDLYGNYVTYTYDVSDLYAYPLTISYGMNSVKDRGIVNRISFSYEDLGAGTSYFNIGGQRGKICRRLSEISTTSNGELYRKYVLKYNTSTDRSTFRYARLVSVREENGKGESRPPVEFKWSYLPSENIEASSVAVPTSENSTWVKEENRHFFAADLNGDGISDIIRISPIKVQTSDSANDKEIRLYVSRSQVSSDGAISYRTPIYYILPPSDSLGKLSSYLGGSSLLDIDGDGYNDIILPYNNGTVVYFTVINGVNIAYGDGGSISTSLKYSLQATKEMPMFVTSDINKDGKDEIIVLEQDTKDGAYPAMIISKTDSNTAAGYGSQRFSLSIPKKPEKMFSGDYNNDGLSDIIVLFEGGYKIFFNCGGTENDLKFADSNAKVGSTIADAWRCEQGDFDGDGLIDFVYYKTGEMCLWIARNNGDGTFTCTKSEDIGVYNHTTGKDDDRFAIKVYDMNQDGMSDVVLCKANYNGKHYKDTTFAWYCSNGTTLKFIKSITKNREDDAKESTIFLGDFNGDGNMELANYGSPLNSNFDDNLHENQIFIYRNTSLLPQTGRITAVTDGMGNKASVEYSYLTNPTVYTNGRTFTNTYPINTYTMPVPVVKRMTRTNGVASEQTTEYTYRDFKMHMRGRGPLGFMETSQTNITTGETTTSTITKWDDRWQIPIETKTVNTIGGKSSTAESVTTVDSLNGTYFAYESLSKVTDMDGNTVSTSSQYTLESGLLWNRTVKNDGDGMYRKIGYRGYQLKRGVRRPTVLEMRQKHADAPEVHLTKTSYTYDENGNILTQVANKGTSLELTTTATYDVYGNRLSSVTSGKGVKSITHYNVYDPSGRFVVKSYQNPAAAVNTFTYDKWGNVLTENDVTDASNVLTTTHTYDNWGLRVSSALPDGTKTTTETGWGNTDKQKYYVLTWTSGSPWVMTWYDAAGHEMSRDTFGPMNVRLSTSKEYDRKGLVTKIKNVRGNLSTTETITYDDFGRVLSDKLNSGRETTYSYGNRTVSATVAGRTSTKTTDAWGNILTSTDPAGNIVKYVYNSQGKPAQIITAGSTVSMTYDDAGNRISMTDPDAGTTKYEYAADGTLQRQTDGRGIQTMYSYDNLGRLDHVQYGEDVVINTYGTSGNGKLRLVKKNFDNNTVEYTHDRFGRVVSETRYVGYTGTYKFNYEYNSENRLSKVTYPGGLEVNYEYDDYGFKTAATVDGKTVYRLKEYDGLNVETTFLDSLISNITYNEYGYEIKRSISSRNLLHFEFNPIFPKVPKKDLQARTTLDGITTEFDPVTGNLVSREIWTEKKEYYNYDELDRLISVSNETDELMSIEYAPNGNISSKTGIGEYTYSSSVRPHAVMSVDNPEGIIPSSKLLTDFNDFCKIRTIEDADSGYMMDFDYGPDLQRWHTVLRKNGKEVRSTVYAGSYEKVTEGGVTREFHYLDGGALIIRENGELKFYQAFTDHLGNILAVYNTDNACPFSASYDAWGKQTIHRNTIGLQRGYTGHEMLPEFGIINMNGRLYDPALGRFFSPDNFVQLPDFSQSYNRYSYCLNNPLKYTDPSGQSFIGALLPFIPVVMKSIANMGIGMMYASYNGQNIWKSAGRQLFGQVASFGIGQCFGNIGSFGHELLRAGAHGISGGVYSMLCGDSFVSGVAAGIASSAVGSFLSINGVNSYLQSHGIKTGQYGKMLSSALFGGVAAYSTGGDFLTGATIGLNIALFNDNIHIQPGTVYLTSQGNFKAYLKGITVTYNAERMALAARLDEALDFAIDINTPANIFGETLEKNSGNSTVGSNGKLYLKTADQRGFNGNQYVKTIKLKALGKSISKGSGSADLVIGSYDIYTAYQEDLRILEEQGSTDYYYTMRAIAGTVGGFLGLQYGVWGGGIFGLGTAGPPGAIVGGFSFGASFGSLGTELGTSIVDYIYGKTTY